MATAAETESGWKQQQRLIPDGNIIARISRGPESENNEPWQTNQEMAFYQDGIRRDSATSA